jgi:hypothetical protein
MSKRSDKPFGSRYLSRDLVNPVERGLTFRGRVPEPFALRLGGRRQGALMDDYMPPMCGRVIQSGGPVRYAIVDGMNVHDTVAEIG